MAGPSVRSCLLARVLSITLLNSLSLGLIVAGQARALAASDETFSIPANLHLSPDLQGRFKVMLAASPTFRSQCQRLADQTELYVRLIVDPRLADGPIRARSVISRLHSGAVVAFVSIGASPDPAEWLAHEIEHVIEQLEGVKLYALAAMNQNVWRTSRDTFETDRAILAGRAVLDEVRSAERLAAGLGLAAAELSPAEQHCRHTLAARQFCSDEGLRRRERVEIP
jgi:hypothetical protein